MRPPAGAVNDPKACPSDFCPAGGVTARPIGQSSASQVGASGRHDSRLGVVVGDDTETARLLDGLRAATSTINSSHQSR